MRIAAACLAAVMFAACSDGGDDAPVASTTAPTTPSTTVAPAAPPPADARLPSAADLGHGFEDLPYDTSDCAATAATPVEAVGAAYVAGPAGPLLWVELLTYDDDGVDTAAALLRDEPACVGFADENDAMHTTVAVHGRTVVLATVALHQGAQSADVNTEALAALAGERLDALDRATTAIRRACRQFYGADGDGVAYDEPQMVERCDVPTVAWRDDCYAERPPRFVVGVGGCAVVAGYLAVYAGTRPTAGPDNRFEVDGTTWSIFPESD